jgi:hypothetical protein
VKRLTILALASLITACGALWTDDPYKVIGTDGVIRLVYSINDKGGSIGRVSGQVVAVGSNETYVVAKRKQDKSWAEFDKEPITDQLMFYYIEKSKDNMYFNGEEITKGPFTLDEFIKLQSELGLPEFSKKF